MIIIVTEAAPDRLRGRLTNLLLEIRAGVYVGDYGAKVRERIWEDVAAFLDTGNAIMAWTAPTESGFDFRTLGPNRRKPVDHEGFKLVSFVAENGG